MPENRVLTRSETERYMIRERMPGQFSAADGGRAARFQLAQDSISDMLSVTDAPEKRAELSCALNSLRAFSREFAKYAESRAMYASARQVYEDYLNDPQSAGGSMLIPIKMNGESVLINSEDLADIAYRCERRIQSVVRDRSRAAEQEFGSDRVVGGTDFYSMTTPECADAVLGYSENLAAGKAPLGEAQTAFAELNRRLAEKNAKHAGYARSAESAASVKSGEPAPDKPDDIREQLDRAMERIAALEEQNRLLSEKNRRLERTGNGNGGLSIAEKSAPEQAGKEGTVRERISFRQLLAEEGSKRILTTADSPGVEKSSELRKREL